MIILTLLSFGLYIYYFLWKMKRTIDALPGRRKVDGNLLALYILLPFIYVGLALLFLYFNIIPPFELASGLFFGFVSLSVCLYVLLLFQIGGALEEYFLFRHMKSFFSGFWPVFWILLSAIPCFYSVTSVFAVFGILFTQHRLNRALESVDSVPYGTSYPLYRSVERGTASRSRLVSRLPPVNRARLERKLRRFTWGVREEKREAPGRELDQRMAARFGSGEEF